MNKKEIKKEQDVSRLEKKRKEKGGTISKIRHHECKKKKYTFNINYKEKQELN